MDWKTEYPTIATINQASFETLLTWDECLPPPQTDVERTVSRRIEKRLFDMAGSQVREKAPDIADKWNELMDAVEKVGMKAQPKMWPTGIREGLNDD